jgi:hypothetical protein
MMLALLAHLVVGQVQFASPGGTGGGQVSVPAGTLTGSTNLAGFKLYGSGAADTNGFLQYSSIGWTLHLPSSNGNRLRVGVDCNQLDAVAPTTSGCLSIGTNGDFSFVGGGGITGGGGQTIATIAPWGGTTTMFYAGGMQGNTGNGGDMIFFGNQAFGAANRFTASSGRQNGMHLWIDSNQTGTAGLTAFMVDLDAATSGSGTSYFARFATNSATQSYGDQSATGTDKFTVDTSGNIVVATSGSFATNGRGKLTQPADGAYQLSNNAGTNVNTNLVRVGTGSSGFELRWTATGAVECDNGDASGYCTWTAGPTTVGTGSLTITNGSVLFNNGATGSITGRASGAQGIQVLNAAGNALGQVDMAALVVTTLNADLTAGACTAGTLKRDTGGATAEMCRCNDGGTAWECWSLTTTNGPTD